MISKNLLVMIIFVFIIIAVTTFGFFTLPDEIKGSNPHYEETRYSCCRSNYYGTAIVGKVGGALNSNSQGCNSRYPVTPTSFKFCKENMGFSCITDAECCNSWCQTKGLEYSRIGYGSFDYLCFCK
ncbi:MAG: hypothetical protein ABIG20_02420 [archaeon]